jgi:hypothetical protein
LNIDSLVLVGAGH